MTIVEKVYIAATCYILSFYEYFHEILNFTYRFSVVWFFDTVIYTRPTTSLESEKILEKFNETLAQI